MTPLTIQIGGIDPDDPALWQRIRDGNERDREELEGRAATPEPENMVSTLARQVPGAGAVVSAARSVRRGFDRLPGPSGTIGGLGALLVVAILLRLALVPVRDDGTTSLGLLFLAMTGRASLSGSQSIPVPATPVATLQPPAVTRLSTVNSRSRVPR